NGIAPRDRLSTQLFNYFAQPPAQRGFCARANEIAQVVSSTPTAQLVEQAPVHLARLDEPFNEFYQAYAQYQVDAVAWDTKYAPRPAIMSTPAPASAVGPTASVTVPSGNN
ncbi:MAG: hypothetical protein ACREB0_12875, partial [Sphingopyxis sp.]